MQNIGGRTYETCISTGTSDQDFGTSVAYLTGETKDPSADKIIVSKEANESLFELTKGLSDQDAAFVERMLAYYKKIKK